MKQRNHTFDLLCGICIIRMIMLHITNACGFGDEGWWASVMSWTYFFMSFFFFKAGYFNKTVSGNSHDFILDKAKRLLIPYAVWGTIGNIIYFFFVLFILDPNNTVVKQTDVTHLWTTSQFFGNVPCWFLVSFFMAYVVAHLVSKVPPLFKITSRGRTYNFKIHWFILPLPLLSYWLYAHGNPLPFGLNNIFIGIFLFYLGRVWHFVTEKMGREVTLGVSGVLLAGYIVVNSTYSGSYTMSDNLWTGNPYSIILSITLVLCGLSGILLSIDLPRIPVINYIGQHSMVFFVAHYPMLILYKLIRSANVHSIRHQWDDYTILLIIIFSLCFLLVPHVEKVPWLSGRFKRRAAIRYQQSQAIQPYDGREGSYGHKG